MKNNIWKTKIWPNDWKKSIYVPIYKKGNKKLCGNYRKIALISHASKILLRILQKIIETFIIPELPIEQAGFRRDRGTRYHIANLRWLMEKDINHQRELSMCFIDYKGIRLCKSYTVDHQNYGTLSRHGSTRASDSSSEKSIHKSRIDCKYRVW